MLVLSLKIPPSTWMGALVSVEELRDRYEIVTHRPEEELGPCPVTALLFLSAVPSFP